MYRVDIVDSQDRVAVDPAFLERVVCRTLEEELVRAAEISLAVVDDATIHRLNAQYLDHDEATDVLSFLLEEDVPKVSRDAESSERSAPLHNASASRLTPRLGAGTLPRGAGKRIEGEVIVSAETAWKRAGDYSWSTRDELVLYVVHGVLHLLGYDDLSEPERQLMRSRERAMLAFWGLTPTYEPVVSSQLSVAPVVRGQ